MALKAKEPSSWSMTSDSEEAQVWRPGLMVAFGS